MIHAVSGICPVEHLGAGRMIRWLEMQKHSDPNWRLCYATNKSGVSACLRNRRWADFPAEVLRHFARRASLYQNLGALSEEKNLLLMHFQEIGFDWCSRLLSQRKCRRPVWFFLFDSSFFCIKSYNYISGETRECLRCLGGDFLQASTFGCQSYPRKSSCASRFLMELQLHAQERRVAFFAQNEVQKNLAMRHFGPNAIVRNCGIWLDDFDALTNNLKQFQVVDDERGEFDVVFHAAPTEAKGFYWALEVARNSPGIRYLFPCSRPKIGSIPANCEFRNMRWDTGLRLEICRAPIVLLPSLWSAPIEGALIKTVLLAKRTAVVGLDSAYSSELGDSLLLYLDKCPKNAADMLMKALSQNLSVSSDLKNRWLESIRANRNFLHRIEQAVLTEDD